jgi:RNA polymerase sigma-70 factor (ECF subfamily)
VRVSRSEQQAVVERFVVAMHTGQVQQLMEVLAPDVVLVADSGGLVQAIRRPIHGAATVAKLLARAEQAPVTMETQTVWLNGAPALRIELDGELGAAVSLVVEDARITRIYIMRNPRKLERLDEPAQLAR